MAYRYRAYCNKTTHCQAIQWMRDMAGVWNAALAERIQTFTESKKNPDIKPVNHNYAQYHHIERKGHPELSHINIRSLQAVLAKLHASYRSFFVLTKKDETARPPKEKEIYRVIELGRVNNNPYGWSLEGNQLTIQGLGRFKLKLHRPIEGDICTVTLKLDTGHWYVCFSCKTEVPVVPPKKTTKPIRLFFDETLFLRDSAGREIPHPQFYFSGIQTLRRLSRSLSRKKNAKNMPCKNRRKARYGLRKWHQHVANQRKYFIESIVHDYTTMYDRIEVPKHPLKRNICQAGTSRKAMSLCDAAYGLFLNKLKHTAEKTGAVVVEYVL